MIYNTPVDNNAFRSYLGGRYLYKIGNRNADALRHRYLYRRDHGQRRHPVVRRWSKNRNNHSSCESHNRQCSFNLQYTVDNNAFRRDIGNGTFNKSGTGTLTLSGTDTYTGATTVSAGTLQLGDGAKTREYHSRCEFHNRQCGFNLQYTVDHNAFRSDIGNWYTLQNREQETLTLSGTNLYTGTTTVSAGTLQLGDGTTTGNIIPSANLITDNAALIYNTPSTITHSGVISGTGTFTKSGTGTLILSGANTYTGATTVSAGELQFNGVNTGTSAKTVSGGTLAGTGTIPGTVTVANVAGSTLRGGTGSGTSGTLTITGALTFSGTSSSLNVTSNGASLSLVSVGTNTITESSGMTVNLLDTMPKGNYTLISKTSGTAYQQHYQHLEQI